MNMSIAIWITRRESNRSARAPKYTEKKRNGSQWVSTATPPSAGEWNFSNMTQ